MLNPKLIYKVLGSLLGLEAIFMTLCLIISVSYGEDDSLAFVISVLITLIASVTCRYVGRDAGNSLSRRDAFLVVTLVWCVFSLFGSLPYIIGVTFPTLPMPILKPSQASPQQVLPYLTMWSICPTAYCSGVPLHSGLADWG